MKLQKTFVNGRTMLALFPFAAHDIGLVMHPDESAKPGCVVMGTGCAHEHDGEPHAPSPLGRLRYEVTTTSTSASMSSTTFGAWLEDLGVIDVDD